MAYQREIETKYEVDAAAVVPELRAVRGVEAVRTDELFHLSAVYFDTAALDLARRRITLRRRTGGKDDGWHLKLPEADGARTEVAVALAESSGPDQVPGELTEALLVHLRGRPLSPIAIIDNDRATTYLHGDGGELLGEFVDDRVHSISLLPEGREQTWREWEFEIPDTAAGRSTAARVDKVLRAAGARTPDRASKLARAIDAAPAAPMAPHRKKATAGEVLVAALAAQRDQLIEIDPRVRAREFDAVHRMRTTTRQLRSVLTEFADHFTGPAPAALRAELRVLAKVLGAVRDAEVAAAALEAAAEDPETGAEDPEIGAAAGLVAARERRAQDRGLIAVDRWLIGDRYLLLLDALDALVEDPPLAGRAGRRATALTPVLHRRYRRFRRAAKRELRDPAVTDHRVHEIRKAAKALRYSALAAAPALPKDTRRELASLREVQELLGRFQDTHLTRAAIAAALPAVTDPAIAFGLGRLDARARAQLIELRAAMPRALRRTR